MAGPIGGCPSPSGAGTWDAASSSGAPTALQGQCGGRRRSEAPARGGANFMRAAPGVSFGDRYQLSNRIAVGGMGEVWEASDRVIGRTVAIKVLRDEYVGAP